MLALALFATAAAARMMDSVPAVPKGWKELRTAEPSESIALRIALRQTRAEALEDMVLQISTPGHPKYGMHLSRDEVRSYTAPTERAVSGVSHWLHQHDIRPLVDNDWITISTTVEKANKLLDTRFAWYEYKDGGGPKLRTLSYSVPDELANHVDLVQPTTRFGQLGAKKSTIYSIHYPNPDEEIAPATSKVTADFSASDAAAAAVTPCNSSYVDPTCLRDLYGVNYTPSNATGNLVAFASFLEEYARYKDLADFEKIYLPSATGQNFSVELINGGKNDQNAADDAAEANLDIQYILAMSHPIPILEYSTGGRGPLVPTEDQKTPPGSNEPYLEYLTYLLAQNDSALPQTISTSYGEEEQSVPADYALKVCNMFMQLGARGVSVLFSSGDSGPGNSCIKNTDNSVYFNPTFPAGCPYVTAVGATTGTNPEVAVGFSSGGFSQLHTRPSWQEAAVAPYVASIGTTYAKYWNTSMRGIPDVAAQGQNFMVVNKGKKDARISGTSASCPAMAGIVALLNAARKTQGQPPLGFLNPWLYNQTAAWTDVIRGAGQGCQSSTAAARIFGRYGAMLNATKGWDPVTGLGTPIFPKLLEAAAPGTKNQ